MTPFGRRMESAMFKASSTSRVARVVAIDQPTILRLCDLIREVGCRDAVERAVRELVKVGLLHRQGECVLPTPAAVYVKGWEL